MPDESAADIRRRMREQVERAQAPAPESTSSQVVYTGTAPRSSQSSRTVKSTEFPFERRVTAREQGRTAARQQRFAGMSGTYFYHDKEGRIRKAKSQAPQHRHTTIEEGNERRLPIVVQSHLLNLWENSEPLADYRDEDVSLRVIPDEVASEALNDYVYGKEAYASARRSLPVESRLYDDRAEMETVFIPESVATQLSADQLRMMAEHKVYEDELLEGGYDASDAHALAEEKVPSPISYGEGRETGKVYFPTSPYEAESFPKPVSEQVIPLDYRGPEHEQDLSTPALGYQPEKVKEWDLSPSKKTQRMLEKRTIDYILNDAAKLEQIEGVYQPEVFLPEEAFPAEQRRQTPKPKKKEEEQAERAKTKEQVAEVIKANDEAAQAKSARSSEEEFYMKEMGLSKEEVAAMLQSEGAQAIRRREGEAKAALGSGQWSREIINTTAEKGKRSTQMMDDMGFGGEG